MLKQYFHFNAHEISNKFRQNIKNPLITLPLPIWIRLLQLWKSFSTEYQK